MPPHKVRFSLYPEKRDIAQESFNWLRRQKHAGYDRTELPQIPQDKEDFVIDLLELKPRRVFARDLKPAQTQIKKPKVIDKIGTNQDKRKYIVSKDGYLVDGHHSWASLIPDNDVITIYQSSSKDIHEMVRILKDDLGYGSKSINENFDENEERCEGEYCNATYQRILKLYRNVMEVDKNRAKSLFQFLGKKYNESIKDFCKRSSDTNLERLEKELKNLSRK
ncbi:gp148 [Sphingomonas phage PAU]|uniref:gp148 n=1 Tax=Sphingomonas phage PAU TaxID=1150991 RepID=UPI00025732E0|nr:gp148 [Sphingomonas phage PAU]AFF28146.1 gp148 [Sphingomonas phage PAU]